MSKAYIPNTMRHAAIIACDKAAPNHPFVFDLQRSKSGYDTAFDGKGWNAHLSHKTYVAIKDKCGL